MQLYFKSRVDAATIGFLVLPATDSELNDFLKGNIHTAIGNGDFVTMACVGNYNPWNKPIIISIKESEILDQWNLVATKISKMTEDTANVALGYCYNNNIKDPLQILNVLMQPQEFNYYILPAEESGESLHARVGKACLESMPGFMKAVKEFGLESYIDYEKAGYDNITDGYIVDDRYFVIHGNDPNLKLYPSLSILQKAVNFENSLSGDISDFLDI